MSTTLHGMPHPLLSELSGMLAVRGLIGVTLGVMTLTWPGASLAVLLTLFAAYAVMDGVLALASAWRGRHDAQPGRASTLWLVVEGVVGIGAGILAVAAPVLTAVMLTAYLGLWLAIGGAARLAAAVRLRHVFAHAWLLGVGGVLGLVIGVYVFAFPIASVPGLVLAVGLYGLIAGAVSIVAGLRVHHVEHDARTAVPT